MIWNCEMIKQGLISKWTDQCQYTMEYVSTLKIIWKNTLQSHEKMIFYNRIN